jgi:hypothetical protein
MALSISLVSPTSALALQDFILIDRKLGERFQISQVSKSGGTCTLTSNHANNNKPKTYGTDKIAKGCRDGRFRLFPLS